MIRKPVISSNLSSVGYDSETNTLEIEFSNFTIYQFFGVQESIYQELMNAISHGKYLHAHIKGIYRYRKIR
jgi:KTSC domain